MNKKVVMSLLLGLLVGLGTSTSLIAKSTDANGGAYTAKDKEYYLTETQVGYIRPGLDLKILDFQIPGDLQPVVEFTVTDPGGMPLDMDGVYTLGPIDIRFMLAFIPMGEEQKVNYHERLRDRGGVYTTISQGHYTYKFSTVLPEAYEVDATHTLAGVATRDLRDFDLDRYFDNEVMNFIPSGNGEPMPRDIVRTATCNRCHDPLGDHGGRYQETEVCQQCHTPDLVDDEDVSHSFDVMVHRVHMEIGSEFTIELSDCESCHTGGIPTKDFPLVASPNPIPTCETTVGATAVSWMADGATEVRLDSADGKLFASSGSDGTADTGNWVKDGMKFVLVEKATGDVLQEMPVNTTILGCAENQPGTFRGEAGALHTNWMNRPSREVCASCHTDVDFVSGENHPPQSSDDSCGNCHRPDSGNEYDISVAGAHTPIYKSNQLPGVLVEIKGLEYTEPGGYVRVTFSLSSKAGPLDPAKLNRFLFTMTGPNEDFVYYNQENALGKLEPSGSNWTYRFGYPIPEDAVGSYSITVEGRAAVVVNEGKDNEFTRNNQIQNFIYPFAVTGDLMARNMIVDDAKCESCHANLSLHGDNRHDASGSCQSCHRADLTDADVRLEGEDESVHFKYMVHKIHMGAELDRGYVVYGYRNSVHDYGHVEYPGDLRNCDACHVDDTQLLPLPDYALDTIAPADYWSPLSPTASTCMSCHDSLDAAAHTQANTSELGESCNLCHGPGASYSVERVHAR